MVAKLKPSMCLKLRTCKAYYILRAPENLELPGNCLWKVIKALSRIYDLGGYYYHTSKKQSINDLHLGSLSTDQALLIRKGTTCSSTLGQLVDDISMCDTEGYTLLMVKMEHRFDVKVEEFYPFEFAGITVESTNYCCTMHQPQYAMTM